MESEFFGGSLGNFRDMLKGALESKCAVMSSAAKNQAAMSASDKADMVLDLVKFHKEFSSPCRFSPGELVTQKENQDFLFGIEDRRYVFPAPGVPAIVMYASSPDNTFKVKVARNDPEGFFVNDMIIAEFPPRFENEEQQAPIFYAVNSYYFEIYKPE